jgi:purine-binding chemotaxis protein CheW
MVNYALAGNRVLIVRANTRVCALPLRIVRETMRALPVEAMAGTPDFVSGVSLIRGIPTPVVDLGVLLGASSTAAGRFVALRLGERQIALAVDAMLGMRDIDEITLHALPSLLIEASNGMLEAVGTLDCELLPILQSSWQLPDAVWQNPVFLQISQ